MRKYDKTNVSEQTFILTWVFTIVIMFLIVAIKILTKKDVKIHEAEMIIIEAVVPSMFTFIACILIKNMVEIASKVSRIPIYTIISFIIIIPYIGIYAAVEFITQPHLALILEMVITAALMFLGIKCYKEVETGKISNDNSISG